MLTAPFCIEVKIITQEVISWMGLAFRVCSFSVYHWLQWKFLSCWDSRNQHFTLSVNFAPTEGSMKNFSWLQWVLSWDLNLIKKSMVLFLTLMVRRAWFFMSVWRVGYGEESADGFSFLICLESFRFRVSRSPCGVFTVHKQNYNYFSMTCSAIH